MQLSRWIWRLNLVGAIAVANLAAFGLCGVLYLYFNPTGVRHTDQESQWMRVVQDTLSYGMVLLAFPAGWIGGVTGPHELPWAAIVCVPLNGYLWGAIGSNEWHKRFAKSTVEALHQCSNENCSVRFASDLSRCPACGATAPEATSASAAETSRPSLTFVLLAGIAAPVVLGGLLLAAFVFWRVSTAIGGTFAGAYFILLVIRWLNRRDDPGKGDRVAPL